MTNRWFVLRWFVLQTGGLYYRQAWLVSPHPMSCFYVAVFLGFDCWIVDVNINTEIGGGQL